MKELPKPAKVMRKKIRKQEVKIQKLKTKNVSENLLNYERARLRLFKQQLILWVLNLKKERAPKN